MQPITVVGRVVAAAVLVAMLLGCTPIEAVDFGNHTFGTDACNPVIARPPDEGYALEGGEVRHGTPADADFYAVTLRPEIAYGDLTGDGIDEAALILDCSTGNRPIPIGQVMAMTAQGATALAPVATPSPPPGALRVELMALDVVEGRLATTWVVLEADDAPCCPTGRLSVLQTWDGHAFVPA